MVDRTRERSSPPELRHLLAGGDRRSLAHATRAVRLILEDRRQVKQLIAALDSKDPLIAMRAADVVEKISRRRPEWVAAYRTRLVRRMLATPDPVIRWNLIQVMPRLHHGPRAVQRLVHHLTVWFWSDASALVRVAALTAIVELGHRNLAVAPVARLLLEEARVSESAAVRARARRFIV